ncbi:hypothetical protein ACLB90_16550 [Stenotrophomonas sp. LGBM10]|uniref:hypothetical protein n=1 Tax=Stenotrophomonas sp. LGBM10 TaxID=3390038 RepID=UPI00398AF5F5
MRSFLLLSALAAAIPAVHAQQCPDTTAAVERAYAVRPGDVLPDRPGWRRDLQAGTCRIWPAHPELTLLAVPIWNDRDSLPDAPDGDLELMVIDTAGGDTRAWSVLRGAIDSDAVRFDGVSLDTARYRLDGAHWTFGVRTRFTGSSSPNPFSDTRLRLVAYAPGHLQVLTQPISVQIAQGEWDTRCAGEFLTTTRTLEVGPPRAQGFADLIVRERQVARRSAVRGDACVDSETPAIQRSYRLRHDGRVYPLLDALSPY